MSRVLRITSLLTGPIVVGVSYYYYFYGNDGYYYNNSKIKRINDRVAYILENVQNSEAIFEKNQTILQNKEARNLEFRPVAEASKDIWNDQIRTAANWVTSLSK